MCEYCEKIFENYDTLEGMVQCPQDYDLSEEIRHGIVRDGDKFNLSIPSDDCFYAPQAEDIKFCPYCGQKLSEIKDFLLITKERYKK